jgi:NTE family protein
MEIRYENLAFEGGGVNGCAYPGALCEFENFHGGRFLSGIKNVSGSSVGSIIATGIACGATADQLREKILSINFKDLLDDSWGVCEDVYRVFTEFGFYKGDALYDLVGNTIQEFTGRADMTFEELYNRTNKHLVVTGTNLDTGSTAYFSRVKYPDMQIRQAVRISSGFPFFYKAVNFKGCYWVDGGVLNNYPIGVFDTPRYCKDGFNTKTLGFKIVHPYEDMNCEDPILYEDDPEEPPENKITSLKSYAIALCNSMYDQCQKIHIKPQDMLRSVTIDVGDSSALNFKITQAQKITLLNAGRDGAQKFIKNNLLK